MKKNIIDKILVTVCMVLFFFTSCSLAIDAIKKKVNKGKEKKEEVLLDNLYWESTNLDLQVGDLKSIKLEALPKEKRNLAKINYSYNDELIKVIADSRGVMVEGLKQGKTLLTAQNGNIVTNCAVKIEGFSEDFEREPYIYTTGNNIIQLKPGTSERVVVSLYGGKVEDNQAFTWESEKPGIAEVLGNGQFCVINGKAEGNSKITVRHPKAAYEFTFLVYVLQDAENVSYITTKSNVVTVKKDTGEKEIEVIMKNAPKGFNTNLYEWKLETDTSNPICSIDANANKCVISPLKTGTARIKISHPSAAYPLEILVRVVEIVENVYITSNETNLVLEGNKSSVIKLELVGYKGVYDKNAFTLEVPQTEVFDYTQYGNEINFKGKKNGTEKIIIRHDLAKYPLEIIVKATKQKYDAVDVSKYITTNKNYIRTKVGAEPIPLGIIFSGGNVGDNKNFKWTIVHNPKKKGEKVIDFKTTDGDVSHIARSLSFKQEWGKGFITGKSEGTATITISHPKALYSTDVIVEVLPEWAVLENELWITGDNIVSLLNGSSKDISVTLQGLDAGADEQSKLIWETESKTIELVANGLNAKIKAQGTEKAVSYIYVKHPRVSAAKKITVLQANTQEELDSMKVLACDTEKYTFKVNSSIDIYVDAFGFSEDEMKRITWEILDPNMAELSYDPERASVASLKGLNAGSTKVICKSNIQGVANLSFDILVVPEDADLSYQGDIVYLTTAENVVVLEKKGDSSSVTVDMKGMISNYEKQSIKWENKNPDVVEIVPNGRNCKVKALKEGEAVLKLSHEKSKNTLNIYVYVGNRMQYKKDKTVYIKTNKDIITVLKNSKPIALTASLENSEAKSGFHFEIDNKNIAKLEYSTSDTYFVKALEAGQANITITHPESKFSKNVLLVVGNTEEELSGFTYLSTANNVITVIEGSKTNVSVTVMNSKDIVLDGYSWESNDRSIADILQSTGATASLVGNSVGTTKLIVKNKLCEYPLEIIVNCVSAAFAASQPYIATPTSVMILKAGENVDWKQITASLEGGTEADQQNFNWSVDDPSMVTAFGQGNKCNIKAMKTGTTRLQISHPKSIYPCYILLICENVKDTKYIISLKNISNLITMKPSDKEIKAVVSLINGDVEDKYNFTWSLDNWDVVEMTSAGNTATIRPLKEGQATIKISHPKANNDETIVVKVQEFSKFGFAYEFIRTSEGANYVIPLQIPVSNIKTHIECETMNDKVCTITNTGKIAQITGIGAGTTTVKAKLVATKTNTVQAEAEMMVIVEKAAEQLTYITTSKTVHVLEKGMTKTLNVDLQGEGIVVTDKYNLQWKSSDPKVVKLLGASTTGIVSGDMVTIQALSPGDAVITVSHEKVNTKLTIKINVPESSEMEISLNKTFLKIEKSGSNTQAELKAILTNAEMKDYDSIEWTADKENGLDIVKVMGTGQSVYILPLEVNKTTKVRAKLPNGKEAVCEVQVVSARQFNFKTKSLTLLPGETKTVDYIFEPKDGHLAFETDSMDFFTYEVDEGTQQINITGKRIGRGKLMGMSESGNASLSIKVDWDYGFTTSKSFIDKAPSEYQKNPNSDEFVIPYTVSPEFADVKVELKPEQGGAFARLSVDKGGVDPDNPNLRRGKIYVKIEKEGKGTINITAINPSDGDKVFGRQSCELNCFESEVQIKLKDFKSDGNFSRIETDADGNPVLIISDGERVTFDFASNIENLQFSDVKFIPNQSPDDEYKKDCEGFKFNWTGFGVVAQHPEDYIEQLYVMENEWAIHYKDLDNPDKTHIIKDVVKQNYKGSGYIDINKYEDTKGTDGWAKQLGTLGKLPYYREYRTHYWGGNYYGFRTFSNKEININVDNPWGYTNVCQDYTFGGDDIKFYYNNPPRYQNYYTKALEAIKGKKLGTPIYYTLDAYKASNFYIEPVNVTTTSFFSANYGTIKGIWYKLFSYNYLKIAERFLFEPEKADIKLSFAKGGKKDSWTFGQIRAEYTRFGSRNTKIIPVYFEKRVGCSKTDEKNESGNYSIELIKLPNSNF